MHETVMAQQIVRAVLDEVTRRGAAACTRIDVDVGALEGLDPSTLQAAFDLEAAGTPLEGAVLSVAITPTTAVCPSCKAVRPFEAPSGPAHELPKALCPDCGSPLELRGGRGFVVQRAAMVLEDP